MGTSKEQEDRDWERVQSVRRHMRNERLAGCAIVLLGSCFIAGLVTFPPLSLAAAAVALAWFFLARRRS